MKRRIIFITIFFLSTNLVFAQNITELDELSKYDTIAGPSFSYSCSKSPQWILYEIILEKYPSELIEKEYYETNSIVSKIYLYWVLRERNWKNLLAVYNDLANYYDMKLIFAPGGCIIFAEPIEIEYIVNFNYESTQEIIDDPLLEREYFESTIPIIPNELLEFLNKGH